MIARRVQSRCMDMLKGDQIAAAKLTDWRKLAQGLHARYLVSNFASAARFVAAISQLGTELGHHPRVVIGPGMVDLSLVSPEAIYRAEDGSAYVVEWVTQRDIDLARAITRLAADQGLTPDPGSVSMLELGLDTAASATIAPVWAALLAGDSQAQGRGTPSDEIRDATGRVPHLWFGELSPMGGASRQRFHVEVYVPAEEAARRVAAVVEAGGVIVDDSDSPGITVIADQEGNRGIICVP